MTKLGYMQNEAQKPIKKYTGNEGGQRIMGKLVQTDKEASSN